MSSDAKMAKTKLTVPELLRQDKRYRLEAYAFVFEALRYGHETLGLGHSRPARSRRDEGSKAEAVADTPTVERHLTGQELCEAIRQYALEQYGYMAKCVLNSWGVKSTGDFGEIVYNLIRVGEFRKTKEDRREDFDDVFDFDAGLVQSFRITRPREKEK
jgi:uncharacterized repeat protein (TIGR04138 family)